MREFKRHVSEAREQFAVSGTPIWEQMLRREPVGVAITDAAGAISRVSACIAEGELQQSAL